MPSVFAALRLITNSNLVDCGIGRSVGLAPPRNPTDVDANLAIGLIEAGPIAHQASRCGEIAELVHRWDSVAGSESNELIAPHSPRLRRIVVNGDTSCRPVRLISKAGGIALHFYPLTWRSSEHHIL
jgi:hypothetical protein